jgi:hypothetical protein
MLKAQETLMLKLLTLKAQQTLMLKGQETLLLKLFDAESVRQLQPRVASTLGTAPHKGKR